MYCSKCGKQIAEGQRFCTNCGNDMSTIRKLADEANDLLKKADKAVGDEVDSIEKTITGNTNQNSNSQNMNQNVNNNNNSNVDNNNNANQQNTANNNYNNMNQQNNSYNSNNNNYYNGVPIQAVKDNRSLGIYILLSILTCGIYSFYFIYKLAKDLNTVCDDGDNTSGLVTFIVLSIVTCGIYYYIWVYKVGNRIQRNSTKFDVYVNENGTTILVWYLVGILLCGIGPFVAMYIMIKNANVLFHAYNKKNGLTFIN